MADVAEIIPESAVDMHSEESKEIKTACEVVENKVVDEKGDGGLPASEETAEVLKESSDIDTTEKAVESCTQEPATETTATVVEPTTETPTTEVVADTTEETSAGGIKRKSEEDEDSSEANEELKKVKTDDSEVTESSKLVTQSHEEPAVVNGSSVPESNGCSDAPDATNGQTCEDIPPEIVTKTVEEVMNQGEDVAASS